MKTFAHRKSHQKAPQNASNRLQTSVPAMPSLGAVAHNDVLTTPARHATAGNYEVLEGDKTLVLTAGSDEGSLGAAAGADLKCVSIVTAGRLITARILAVSGRRTCATIALPTTDAERIKGPRVGPDCLGLQLADCCGR